MCAHVSAAGQVKTRHIASHNALDFKPSVNMLCSTMKMERNLLID